jgi:hypothetical protein
MWCLKVDRATGLTLKGNGIHWRAVRAQLHLMNGAENGLQRMVRKTQEAKAELGNPLQWFR